ncbi:hypothetical protein [Evansella tamaricis]|uniref:Tetratricopeptide repeat protein n=1 Tax=Evansella tamaricis TaxID=2069301 RepID=A0ABS6JLD8_9BACI|nr:hypothetical protein [Evansella tamaricis]MBU9713662.1 hypothetical protein [Evansella tamaricis]
MSRMEEYHHVKTEVEQNPYVYDNVIHLVQTLNKLQRENEKSLEEVQWEKIEVLDKFMEKPDRVPNKAEEKLIESLDSLLEYYGRLPMASGEINDRYLNVFLRRKELGEFPDYLQRGFIHLVMENYQDNQIKMYQLIVSTVIKDKSIHEKVSQLLLHPEQLANEPTPLLEELEPYFKQMAELNRDISHFYKTLLEVKIDRLEVEDPDAQGDKLDILRELIKYSKEKSKLKEQAEILLLNELEDYKQFRTTLDKGYYSGIEEIYQELYSWFPQNKVYKDHLIDSIEKQVHFMENAESNQSSRSLHHAKIEAYEKLIRLKPNDKEYNRNLATFYFQGGKNLKRSRGHESNFELAERYFGRYIDLSNEREKYQGYYYLGLLFLQQKDWGSAYKKLKDAVKLAPTFDDYFQVAYPYVISCVHERNELEADRIIEEMESHDKEFEYRKEIEFVRMYKNMFSSGFAYTVFKNGKEVEEISYLASEKYIEDLLHDNPHSFILDMRNPEVTYVRGIEDCKKNTSVLKTLLYRHLMVNGSVSVEDARIILQKENVNVARYINMFKEDMYDCVGNKEMLTISHAKQSVYYFEFPADTYIIQPINFSIHNYV